MKQQNCTVPNCWNNGRYARNCGHLMEEIKPAKVVAKKSETMKERLKRYTKIAKAFLALNSKCAVCGKPAQCVHHKRGRIGDLLFAVKHFLAVCFDCHRKIEDNPDWAKENGYSDSRLEEIETTT